MKVHANTLRLDLLATTRFSVAILVRALQFAISIHFNMTKHGWVWCGQFCKNGEAVFWNFHHTMYVENLQVGLNAATTFSLLPRHNCKHEYLQDLKFWQTKVRRSFLWLLYNVCAQENGTALAMCTALLSLHFSWWQTTFVLSFTTKTLLVRWSNLTE